MEDLKVGDRFEWYMEYSGQDVHECEFLGCGKFKVISGVDCNKIVSGRAYLPDVASRKWKFIGNFSKSSNFNNLYKLLSNE